MCTSRSGETNAIANITRELMLFIDWVFRLQYKVKQVREMIK